MDIDLPDTQGSLKTNKGTTKDGLTMLIFDAVPRCDPDGCPVESECEYSKSGKCGLQKKYLRSATKIVFDALPDNASELEVMKAGLQIIPLYGHLIRMKLAAHNIRPTYTTEKGVIKAHPLFREIRDTIRAIDSGFNNLVGKENNSGYDPLTHGEEDYYDSLTSVNIPAESGIKKEVRGKRHLRDKLKKRKKK